MRSNTTFRSFLEIDTQMPESVAYQPFKIAEINNLSLGGRDFAFVEKRGLLFVAMSEMNITSRMDSYITNVSTKITPTSKTLIDYFYVLNSSLYHGRRKSQEPNRRREQPLGLEMCIPQ